MLRLMPSSGQAQQVLPRLLSQQHQWPPAPLDHLLYRKHWLSKPRCWLQRQLELPQQEPSLTLQLLKQYNGPRLQPRWSHVHRGVFLVHGHWQSQALDLPRLVHTQ